MKKVSVYLRNHIDGPSCYYRVVQFINHIDNVDFKINNALNIHDFRRNMDEKNRIVKKILQALFLLKICIRRYMQIKVDLKKKPDAIIIQREMFPRVLPKFFIRMYKKLLSQTTVIWDFDDSILTSGEISRTEWSLLSKYSNKIVATSDYLLESVQTEKEKKVALPTTDGFCENIDLCDIQDKRENIFGDTVNLVWIGTHSNLNNIVKILPQLNKAGLILKQHNKKLELEIVCNVDVPELYAKYDGLNIKFTFWTRENAQNAILKAHIGLMPIPDNEFSKGKGGFKLVQCIASGIPVIGSNVGFNKEIVTSDIGVLIDENEKWGDAVAEFAFNFDKWKKSALAAQKRYQEKFSYRASLDYWKRMLAN